MNVTAVSLLTFGAAATAVIAAASVAWDLFLRRRWEVRARLADEFGARTSGPRRSPLFKDLKLLAAESEKVEQRYWVRWEAIVEQSALPISPERVLAISALAGVLVGLAAGLALRSVPLGLLSLVAAAGVPVAVVLVARKRRIGKLLGQLPEAFEMMSRSIKAGLTISGAFQVVASDFEAPLAEEFAFCHEQQSLGLPYEVALRELGRRTGVVELQMLVVAMLVQRQAGGNPVQVLDNLSSVVRKRMKIKTKVKALTAQGRMQAMVLLSLPPLLLAVIYLLNRDYAEILLRRPDLLGAMAASECIGAVFIRKIINFDY